ncbi:hypothetical protein [Lactobacillus phage Dionysus]|nr:hypothetical protein [Lactobacillus phage Dionysus]
MADYSDLKNKFKTDDIPTGDDYEQLISLAGDAKDRADSSVTDNGDGSVTINNKKIIPASKDEVVSDNKDNTITVNGKTYVPVIDNQDGTITVNTQRYTPADYNKVNNEFTQRGVNVKWFGAVGDGETDDTEALINARDFCDEKLEKQVLFFPPGEFLLNKTLQFNTEIAIVGTDSSWLRLTGTGDGLVLGPDNISENNFQEYKRFSINGLGFKGGDATRYGIRFNKFVTQSTISNCNFVNFGGTADDLTNFAIYFDENNWYGVVQGCKFDVTKAGGRRQFVSMDDFGNSRIEIKDNLVTSLSGLGVAVVINGVNCHVINNKIEGFQVNVRIGGSSHSALVANNYFEKANNGSSGAIQFMNNNDGISATGVVIANNYANLHEDLDGSSYFVSPGGTDVLIRNATVQDNYINGYVSEGVNTAFVVNQNNLINQTGNRASGNRGIGLAGLFKGGSNVASWSGENSNLSLKDPLQSGTIVNQTITKDNTSQFDILSSSRGIVAEVKTTAAKDVIISGSSGLIAKAFASGKVAFGKGTASAPYDFDGQLKADAFIISKQTGESDVPAGTIYESTDGKLCYKRLDGTRVELG